MENNSKIKRFKIDTSKSEHMEYILDELYIEPEVYCQLLIACAKVPNYYRVKVIEQFLNSCLQKNPEDLNITDDQRDKIFEMIMDIIMLADETKN